MLPIDEAFARPLRSTSSRRSRGDGPNNAILALGYAERMGRPAASENEINQNGWLHCSADPDLIFGRYTPGR